MKSDLEARSGTCRHSHRFGHGCIDLHGTTADSGGAPATALAFVPSGEFAYVTYLHAVATPGGSTLWDSVATYSVNPTSGLLSGPIGTAATGDNPWAAGGHSRGTFCVCGKPGNAGQCESTEPLLHSIKPAEY